MSKLLMRGAARRLLQATSLLAAGSFCLIASALSAPAEAGPCEGVGVALPDGSNVLNPSNGSIGCTSVAGGTLSYDGGLRPAVDLGAPQGTTTYSYDPGPGQVLGSDTEPPSRTTTYTYDSDRLSSATAPSGVVTHYTYDPATDRLTSESDTAGRMITYTYYDAGPDTGKLKQATDAPSGVTTTYTYYDTGHDAGLLQSASDSHGNVTMYLYDTENRLSSDTVTNGATTTVYDYAYDGFDRMTTETTNPGGTQTQTIYDYGNGPNPLDHDTDPLGHVTSYIYDGANRVTSDTDPNGTTGFIYSADIPEPNTLLLLGAGLAATLWRRRARPAAI
jgi:YD repeat-containing protein